MKAGVYSIEGKKISEMELPKVFDEEVRPELIKRAVFHEQSEEYQPKGAYKLAGMQTTAEYQGRKENYRAIKNKGISRLPREKLPKGRFGRVRMLPFAVGGRRAHPPNPDKVLIEKMNNKEYAKAMRCAIAATASKKLVGKRGHLFGGDVPIVIEAKFESIAKTRDVAAAIEKLGLMNDVEKSRNGTKARSGVGVRRRGGRDVPRSVLFVVKEGCAAQKAARNLAGADVCSLKNLDARKLAPGAKPGRLTVWSESVLKEMAVAQVR